MATTHRSQRAILALSLLAFLWGSAFTSLAGRQSANLRSRVSMKGSIENTPPKNAVWVNKNDPTVSHPSGLYMAPISPPEKKGEYRYEFVEDENGNMQTYVKVATDKLERMGDSYVKRTGWGAFDHW
eukprot:TRINITY_DN655_c0_g2_i1.p1 TRINITY_DN655_c0_g2~~TRINITY_DN655_c0_g2_i1.p1  ORF type:complete len:127 (-),score=26.21 TRINITY_DN655_c0_g2_i1:239-619(-)